MEFTQYQQGITFYHHAESLNEQMHSIQGRMQAHVADLDRVSFALYDSDADMLRTYADSTFLSLEKAHYEAPLDSLPTLKKCVESKQPRILSSLTHIPPSRHVSMLIESGFRSSAAIPCFRDSDFIGFVFLNSYRESAFDIEIIHDLKPYIDMVAFSVISECQIVWSISHYAEQVQKLAPCYHKESQAHKERVSAYTRIIANHVAYLHGFDDETIEHLSMFAQFHDLGKTRLPVTLLCKESPLTTQEVVAMQSHIGHGLDIIDEALARLGHPQHPCIQLLSEIMAHHHEFMDGSGYPNHLRGEEIPIAARIVAVANVFDAMTTHKPYRQACDVPHALLEMEKMVNQGKLDRECVNALREAQSDVEALLIKYPEFDPKDGFY
ncbi:HD-GYP domain-containing protein [Vibrio sonorensis]|uniref:HD-GYP domain-containing protein n=1 Tax=Vibrio sonorensis TaxID=1004316 RepID=UPI0008D8F1C9|nr:HD domain-containing phosphohydrolase [Vibrio sonorensis]